MNIIIIGCGKVGMTLVENLSVENNHITVVDLKAEEVTRCTNTYDVMGIVGNGSDFNLLKEAGLKDADLLIAVTGSDTLNMLCCVIAHKQSHCDTIARVRDTIYSSESKFIKHELGITKTFNPEFASAVEILRLLRFPNAIEIDTFAKGLVEILRFVVPENSPLDNMALFNMNQKLGCRVLICAVERGDEAIIPNGSFVLKSGDKLSILATEKDATDFFRSISIKINHIKSVMIVGGGTISFYLAKLLQNSRRIILIEKDPKRCEVLTESLSPKVRVVCGDGSDFALLKEEGVDSVDAFVALTDIDEENIILSMAMKSREIKKVITKINRIEIVKEISQIAIDSVIVPRQIASEYILRYVRARDSTGSGNVETLYRLLDGRVEALEFIIKEENRVCDILIKDMKLRESTLIVGIHRGGKLIFPTGSDCIKAGDSVIVVTAARGVLHNIDDILRG